MKEFMFDPTIGIPIVSGILSGPLGTRRINMILDTGAALTQVNATTLALLGYGADRRIKRAVMVGAVGERQEGALVTCDTLMAFGKRLEGFVLGSFDFIELAAEGIEGLLGWDIVKKFHLDMNGPKGILKVY